MLGFIAAVLIISWLLGLFAFHVSTGLFHILLVVRHHSPGFALRFREKGQRLRHGYYTQNPG